MYCQKCGKEINDGSVFCQHCGASQLPANNEPVYEQPQAYSQPYEQPVRARQAVMGIVGFFLALASIFTASGIAGLVFAGSAAILCLIALLFFKGQRKGLAIAGLVISICVLITSTSGHYFMDLFKSKLNETVPKSSYSSGKADNGTKTDSNKTNTTEKKETDKIVGSKTSFKDLKLGDIGKHGDIYVGLQYVKRANVLYTDYGSEINPSEEGNEILVGFFEFYNGGSKEVSVDPDDITCYVDGKQFTHVDTYVLTSIDGELQFNGGDLETGREMISAQDYEVPSGWSEAKFYYKSDCVWTISSADAATDDYQRQTLFDIDYKTDETKIDDIIYDEEYEVQFKGACIDHVEALLTDDYYVAFKFKITNTGNKTLDTSRLGHNMTCYQDNHLLDGSEWVYDDNIENYINVHNIDSIEPGMSSDVYVKFEVSKTTGDFLLIFDDGSLLNSHICGYVFTTIK